MGENSADYVFSLHGLQVDELAKKMFRCEDPDCGEMCNTCGGSEIQDTLNSKNRIFSRIQLVFEKTTSEEDPPVRKNSQKNRISLRKHSGMRRRLDSNAIAEQ